jgi:two-component system sensor histidine kinase ChvG
MPSRRPRRLRVTLVELGLALVVLPLVLLAVAVVYERWSTGEQQRMLSRAAAVAAAGSPVERARLAARDRVIIARLDATGTVVERAPPAATPLGHSPIGAVGERLVGEGEHEQTLDRADAQLPPWTARAEVRAALAGAPAVGQHLTPDGEALVVTAAAPLAGGGALYLLAGSHRGVRRLVRVRRQLAELVVYELVLAAPLLIVFAIGLARPLERLADAARRYPAAPLADARLLGRRDEIGALARTLAQMTEDLDARRRAAAELGADIAHEFKNPLATIAASAELLASTERPGPDRLALCAQSIGGAVERLRRSIDELLALLRLEQAVPGEAREATPYGPFLEALADEYRRDPRAGGWTFAVDVTPAAAACAPPLNRQRWTEMLRNLVDNALVQPSAVRRIDVGARVQDGDLVTFVRDHGPGISPENRARIFRRFFTQRPPGAPPGTGLGLSIVETVAYAHGARVDVRSEPGQGAELRVTLPL